MAKETPVGPTGQKHAYSVPEAAEQLSLGQSAVWAMIHDGRLRTVRVGRRVIVPAESIERFLREAS